MKGLLIKDFKLLKNQKTLVFVFLAVTLFLLVSEGISPLFVVGYATFIGAVVVISTISYDEYDNGNAFLFTLPFRRKDYVREKYLFALLCGGAAWLLSTAAVIICSYLKYSTLSITDTVFPALLILAAFGLIASAMLPIQLKFGQNKGTIAIFVTFFAIAAVIWLISKLLHRLGIGLQSWFEALQTASAGTLCLICLAVSAGLFFLSLRISTLIVERKEF